MPSKAAASSTFKVSLPSSMTRPPHGGVQRWTHPLPYMFVVVPARLTTTCDEADRHSARTWPRAGRLDRGSHAVDAQCPHPTRGRATVVSMTDEPPHDDLANDAAVVVDAIRVALTTDKCAIWNDYRSYPLALTLAGLAHCCT